MLVGDGGCDTACAAAAECEYDFDDCGEMLEGTSCPKNWYGDDICDLICVLEELDMDDGGDCRGMLS
jgi:hypothetical protein